MRRKEDKAECIKNVRQALVRLLQAETAVTFDEQWDWIQVDWADQYTWLKYMCDEWIPKKERWGFACRRVSFILRIKIFH